MSESDTSAACAPRWQRVYVASALATTAFCVVYALAEWGEWPKLTYYPYEREFALATRPVDPVPMTYLGLVAWGLGGAFVTYAVTWAGLSRLRRPIPDRWLHLIGGWALTAFVVVGCFYTWNLWPF